MQNKSLKIAFLLVLLLILIYLVFVKDIHLIAKKLPVLNKNDVQQISESEDVGEIYFKKYTDEDVSFEYPSNLHFTIEEKKDDKMISLDHSISFKHQDYDCDFSGDGYPEIDRLTDFGLGIGIYNKPMFNVVRQKFPFVANHYLANGNLYIDKGKVDEFSFGKLHGFEIQEGVRGCGNIYYLLPIKENKTILITRSMQSMKDIKIYFSGREIPNTYIDPRKQDEYFNKILESLSIKNYDYVDSLSVPIIDFPSENETLVAGQKYTIKWHGTDSFNKDYKEVRINFMKQDKSSAWSYGDFDAEASNTPIPNNGSYEITIPDLNFDSSKYRIYIMGYPHGRADLDGYGRGMGQGYSKEFTIISNK